MVGRPRLEVTKPAWFNLKSYDVVGSLSYKEMASNLRARRYALQLIISQENENSTNWLSRFFEKTRHNPILSIEDSKELLAESNSVEIMSYLADHSAQISNRGLRSELEQEGLSHSHLSSLDYGMACAISGYFAHQEHRYNAGILPTSKDFAKLYKSYDELELTSQRNERTLFSKVSYLKKPDRLHIALSLSAPDKVLKEQFESWLIAARKKFDLERQSSYAKAKLSLICNNKILPLIDLGLWAESEGVKIGERNYYEFLHPNGIDTNITVKINTAKNYADEFLNSHFINLLDSKDENSFT